MDVQQPSYKPQDLLDAVIGQRNAFANDVALAQAIIKAKTEENRMLTDKKDQELAILRASQEQLLSQRGEWDVRIADQVAEIAALKAKLAEAEPAQAPAVQD